MSPFGGSRRLHARLLVLLVLGATLLGAAQGQGISREQRLRMLEAVVQVQSFDESTGMWMHGGSGTIISPDGHILTNYHVIGDVDAREHFEWSGIYLTSVGAPDLPPQLTYWARYVVGDPALDLAVLQIVEYSDETPVEPGKQFPAMPVGDSNTLILGDTLTVVGYPSISGSTITFTQGIMSGWLGEDTLSGGKQWIKTDAKIARGNSGGAAFNEAGELVGIPTLGIHTIDGHLHEEQVMIRPVALAWALLGPHVPSVLRPAAPRGVQAGTETALPGGEPSGEFGGVPLGGSVGGVAGAVPAAANLVFHTYTLDVPAGDGGIVITVDASARIGLAGKYGSPILTYEEVDFIATVEGSSQRVELADPPPGQLWIDVVHWERAGPVEYTLSAVGLAVAVQEPGQSGQAGEDPVGPGSPLVPPPVAQADEPGVGYPAPVPFGTIGALQPGVFRAGNLLQSPGVTASTFHTYTIDVPAGTAELVIELTPAEVLDVAAKYGSQITSYADPAEGGDYEFAAITETPGTTSTITVSAPAPGRWFIDVVNWENSFPDGRYVIVARLR